jgi:hypothetical protein
MKKIVSLLALTFAFAAPVTFSCDEQCLKEKAKAKHNVQFPGYLTAKYCEGISLDFMTSTMRSLNHYRTNNLETKFKGPLKNTKNYLAQRKEWLQECDDYLSMTQNSHVFNDEKTTKQIFASINSIESEMEALINGVSYSVEAGEGQFVAINDKFNNLFRQVDNHKTLMHLRGKYVVR